MPEPGDRGERSTVHLLLVDSFVPGVLCHRPRKRAKGAPTGGEGGGRTSGFSILRHSVFSSRIYIMDLPRTTSEIESLHGCADCWKSVSEFYYPFALCDARIFHVVNCAPLVAGSRCSWERLEKISGRIISDIHPFQRDEDYLPRSFQSERLCH